MDNAVIVTDHFVIQIWKNSKNEWMTWCNTINFGPKVLEPKSMSLVEAKKQAILAVKERFDMFSEILTGLIS